MAIPSARTINYSKAMQTKTIDELEIEYGTAILSALTGQHLTRNQQPVRLFDETRKSAEFYYRSDKQGKPYIQDHQNGKRYYPVTAYAEVYQIDFNEAKESLIQQYYGEIKSDYAPRRPRPAPRPMVPPPPPIDYIPLEYYQQSQTGFEHNGLYEYLRFTYGLESAQQVFTRYRLGTSKRWQYLGYLATCLPQFDQAGNLRQIKVMAFDAMNGRRVKSHQSAQQWDDQTKQYKPTEPGADKSKIVGRYLPCYTKDNRPNLQQCFFGEHLLREPDRYVALVEGETTAMECSIQWPQFIWLATGGSNGAGWTKPDVFSMLRGRDVTLWPDTGKLKEWSEKAAPLRPMVRSLSVTDYVDKEAPPGMGNVDLRDLLTRPRYLPPNEQIPIYGEVL